MTGHALSGAFKAVCALNHSINDWYDEQSFKLYYYLMCYDPSTIIQAAPLSQSLSRHVVEGVHAARSSLMNNSMTQAATGYQAKPSYGNVWSGCLYHAQNSLRPAIDMALRNGINGPLRIAMLGIAAVMMMDYMYGGHLRDTAAQIMNNLTGEVVHKDTPGDQSKVKTGSNPLYAQPSVS